MGSSLSCCNYSKDEQVKYREELNLENNTTLKKKTSQDNITTRNEDRTITLITQEKIMESVESPKYSNNNNNLNRDLLVQHLRKASNKLEEIKDEGYLEHIENFDASQCPKLKLFMTSIYSNNTESRILNINHLGLENSIREAHDGVVYFGSTADKLNFNVDVELDFIQLKDERVL